MRIQSTNKKKCPTLLNTGRGREILEAEEADNKVEVVAPGVTVASLIRFRVGLIGSAPQESLSDVDDDDCACCRET